MQKTAIPWADYSINPVRGLCPMDCKDLEGKPYCYARKMYKRFHLHKDGTVNPVWDYETRYDVGFEQQLYDIPDGSKVFVGSTMELFGTWVKEADLRQIIGYTKCFPNLTFIFLTKCPQNLARWSPFPPNVWVLISVTNQRMWNEAICALSGIEASVKGISLEPWLEEVVAEGAYDTSELDWLILGSRTQPTRHPPLVWVERMLKQAVPIFVKEPLASHFGIDRRRFPNVKSP